MTFTNGSSLDRSDLHVPVVVSSVELDRELTEWLSAVGIRAGEKVTVLRRAAFGGPLHVRTGAGGEFALGRSLARAIVVTPVALDEAAE